MCSALLIKWSVEASFHSTRQSWLRAAVFIAQKKRSDSPIKLLPVETGVLFSCEPPCLLAWRAQPTLSPGPYCLCVCQLCCICDVFITVHLSVYHQETLAVSGWHISILPRLWLFLISPFVSHFPGYHDDGKATTQPLLKKGRRSTLLSFLKIFFSFSALPPPPTCPSVIISCFLLNHVFLSLCSFFLSPRFL